MQECCSQLIELPALEPLILDHVFEGLSFVEPAHHHQPIDGLSPSADRQAASCCGQRHDRKVNIGRKPVIQAQFGPASSLAPVQSGEIQIREPHRLLELVDLVTGKENPRHVGFAADYVVNRRRIALRRTEESNLEIERRRRFIDARSTRAGRQMGLLHEHCAVGFFAMHSSCFGNCYLCPV